MQVKTFSNALVGVVGAYAEAMAELEAKVVQLEAALRSAVQRPKESPQQGSMEAKRLLVLQLALAWSKSDGDQTAGAAHALRSAVQELTKAELAAYPLQTVNAEGAAK